LHTKTRERYPLIFLPADKIQSLFHLSQRSPVSSCRPSYGWPDPVGAPTYQGADSTSGLQVGGGANRAPGDPPHESLSVSTVAGQVVISRQQTKKQRIDTAITWNNRSRALRVHLLLTSMNILAKATRPLSTFSVKAVRSTAAVRRHPAFRPSRM